MHNSRFTPIAVSLSLIVAMALQPIAVCCASRDCSSGCTAAADIPTETCNCCCVHRVNSEPRKATSPCCGVDQTVADRNGSNSREMSDESAAVESVALESVAPEVRRVCLCDQNPQPISDSSTGRITGKLSVSFSMLPIDSDGSGLRNRARLMTAKTVDRFQGRSHPSQVDLSVWRL